ncbi:hypothetical protein AMJ80_02230 [bacterium SM23_31]|nr:MAG: hypothetical protein AMJ80_02230 [bacterium SM23_31]
MKLSEVGVNRPVFTSMIFFAVLLLGIIALIQLPVDIMPDLELPTLSIITMYQGAATEEVESRVTQIIEDNVSTIPRLKEVYSMSQENLSAITLGFEWGTNLDEAAGDIRQQLDMASQFLPEDAERPMLVKFDFSMMPVAFFGITAEESYINLYDIVDKQFCNAIRRIPGVAMTVIIGGLQREIKVNVDRQRLEAYHLSINQIAGILATENITQSAGALKIGRTDYVIRVPGEFKNVNEINKVIVGNQNGSPIYLKDIATVEDSFKDIDSRVRIDRYSGLMVLVQKQSDANTVEVVDRIKKALPDIERTMPSDVKTTLVWDTSEFIERSINNLLETVLWALFFVSFIVFIFLREIRGSFIIIASIPFSLIIAFIFLYVGGYTINMMSLSAIAIAVGMVVDMAIVIYENIYRHRTEEEESRREAAIFGSDEVGLAVTASTITTVSIFLPIIFVKGVTGIMFKELSYVVIIVLLASLFTALNFTPMLASKFMKIPSEYKKRSRWSSNFQTVSGRWFKTLESRYKILLNWALNHRSLTLGGGLVIFLLSLLLLFIIPTGFMPAVDDGTVMGTIELSVGTRIEETDKVMQQIETIIEENVPEREMMFARAGESESGMGTAMGQRSDINIMMVGVQLVPKNERDRSKFDVADMLRNKIAEIPGVEKMDFTEQDIFSMLSGGEKPVSINIYGFDIETTDAFAVEVKNMMDRIEGLTDVVISRGKGRPELWIEVDREKASSLGLNMAQISSTLRTNLYGKIATLYREGGDEYNTFVQLKESDRQTIDDLKNVFITSPLGRQIPIMNIAKVTERGGPLIIERKNQERVVLVGGGLYNRTLGDVVADLRKELETMSVPSGVTVEIGGTAEDQEESFRLLLYALIIGIVLVYMVMASQFESFLDPFIIIFTVPFAIVGVLWALLITGKMLSLISFIGMIMLIGIVVNNAIILVDYINILRRRGLGIKEAILITGPRRLRPILMTVLTLIFGLTPLALKTGEGSEIWSPLGISVIGGLIVSTLISLIFVPTLYSVFEERFRALKNNR